MAVLFEVTNSCNLNCKHCYNKNLNLPDLSLEQIKSILKAMRPLKTENLILSGGEPFLRKDLFSIIDFACECGFNSITINTNGTLLNKKNILEDINNRNDIITAIVVSFDGATSKSHDYIRGEGEFSKLVNTLEKITPDKLPLGINVTIGKWNFKEFNDFFTIYDKFNAFYINYGLFIPIGNGLGLKDQIISPEQCSNLIMMTKEKRDYGYNVDLCSFPYSKLKDEEISGYCCNLFTDFITVTAQGNVIPCIMYDFNCGSLLEPNMDIKKILKHPLIQIFRDPSKLKKKMKGKCRDCSEFNICKGGCKLLALSLKNDMFESDPLCPLDFLFENDF